MGLAEQLKSANRAYITKVRYLKWSTNICFILLFFNLEMDG